MTKKRDYPSGEEPAEALPINDRGAPELDGTWPIRCWLCRPESWLVEPPSPAGRLDGSDLEGVNMRVFWKIRKQDGRRQGWYLLGTGAGSVLCGIASAMIQSGGLQIGARIFQGTRGRRPRSPTGHRERVVRRAASRKQPRPERSQEAGGIRRTPE
jgi:hypothetical protein